MDLHNQGQIRDLSILCSRKVIEDMAPRELDLVESWIDTYLSSEAVDTGLDVLNHDSSQTPFGIGMPELVVGMVSPIIVEIIKEFVIPIFHKQSSELRNEAVNQINLALNTNGNKYDVVIKLRFSNKKQAQQFKSKILAAITEILRVS